jgi:ferrous iron transport protein B
LELWEKQVDLPFLPLGYDWKIGIAIISSFAAREVLLELWTIYSVGGSENEVTIKNKMAEINPVTGEKIFLRWNLVITVLCFCHAMPRAHLLTKRN